MAGKSRDPVIISYLLLKGYWDRKKYLNKLSLPRLQDGSGFILIPVDVMDLVVILKVFIQLLGAHEEKHSLHSLCTAKRKAKQRVSHMQIREGVSTLSLVLAKAFYLYK